MDNEISKLSKILRWRKRGESKTLSHILVLRDKVAALALLLRMVFEVASLVQEIEEGEEMGGAPP